MFFVFPSDFRMIHNESPYGLPGIDAPACNNTGKWIYVCS